MGTHVRRALEAAATELNQPVVGKRSVRGSRGRFDVRFEVESSGWSVSARITPGPYALDLHPRQFGPATLDDLLDEHPVGDPVFDAAFAVTGAPVPFLDQVFESRIRRRLRYLQPRHVQIEDGFVRVVKRYAYFCAEPEQITAAIDIATRIASNVEAYAQKVHRDALTQDQWERAPYRGSPDRRNVMMVLAQRYLPVSSYLDRRTAVERKQRRRTRAAAGLVLAWGFLIFLANVLG